MSDEIWEWDVNLDGDVVVTIHEIGDYGTATSSVCIPQAELLEQLGASALRIEFDQATARIAVLEQRLKSIAAQAERDMKYYQKIIKSVEQGNDVGADHVARFAVDDLIDLQGYCIDVLKNSKSC
jgi:hypothetical protein